MSENVTNTKLLTTKQRAAIAALLAGGTVRAAALAVGVAEKTIYRWMTDPAFSAALKAAEGDAVNEASRQLVSLASVALEQVRTILEDTNTTPTLRLRAAQIVLENLLRLRELATLEERITALEAANNGRS